MLELMRKHAGSWIIKILLGAIALAFALSWGVTSYYSHQSVAVKVNNEPITIQQVQDEYGRLNEQAKRQFGPQYDKIAQLLNLKERAMSRLVDRTLVFQAARQMGVRVGDAEVRSRLAATPAFQVGGQFDFKQYQRVLGANRLRPEVYESLLRADLVQDYVLTLVTGSAQVTALELDQALEQTLAQVKGLYLLYKPEAHLAKVQVSADELAAYYQEHKNDFLVPEKVKFAYVIFPLASFRDQVQVTDDDLAEAYERDRTRYFRPEAVHARHILISVKEGAAPAEEEAAKAKAEDILARAKSGKEDFAALAKKYSQGPTAAKGGDLGLFTRGEMVGPFEDLAFSLEAGQVGLVRANQGYHVVKVEEHRQARVIPLEEARGELRQRLEEQGARERAEVAAERAYDQVQGGLALEELAKQQKLSTHESPLMSMDDELPGLPGVKGLVETMEGLNPGQAAPAISYEGGSVLAVLKEKAPEQIRPLEEVKEEVRQAVAAAKAAREARQEAAARLEALGQEADPAKALAALPGVKRTDWLGPQDAIDGLTQSQGLVQALLLRPVDKPMVMSVVETGGGFAVAAVSARRQNPNKEQAGLREQLRQQLLDQKRSEAYLRFVDDLRTKATIKVLAQL